MRQLTKLFLLLMMFTLALTATAAAQNTDTNELQYVKAYDASVDGREVFRIEIGFKNDLNKDEPIYDVNLMSSISRTMIVDLKETIPAQLTRHGGSNIEYSGMANSITAKEVEPNHTQLQINFDKTIDDFSFKVHAEPSERSKNLPARLMIDIAKHAFVDDFDGSVNIGSGAIALDPGHGGSDAGAIGPTGVKEKDVALGVALKVQQLLQAQGNPVVMTRTTDRDVYSANATNAQELQARVSKAPHDAAIFISIHCNAFSNPASHGMETYYYTDSGWGRRLAKLLNEELEKFGGLANRGVKSANFYVLKHSPMPASLIELGFVTNPEEERMLANDNYQEQLAQAIVTAINRYFGRAAD